MCRMKKSNNAHVSNEKKQYILKLSDRHKMVNNQYFQLHLIRDHVYFVKQEKSLFDSFITRTLSN
jgi:hypothetical protein